MFAVGPLSLSVLILIVLFFLSLYDLNGITHFFNCLPSKSHCSHTDCPRSDNLIKIG